jgi:hypothetical protein
MWIIIYVELRELPTCAPAAATNMPSIEHLQSLTLEFPPSCIEFCPKDSQYAVIGTYNLEISGAEENAGGDDGGQKKSQQRNGSLILVRVSGSSVYVLFVSDSYARHLEAIDDNELLQL